MSASGEMKTIILLTKERMKFLIRNIARFWSIRIFETLKYKFSFGKATYQSYTCEAEETTTTPTTTTSSTTTSTTTTTTASEDSDCIQWSKNMNMCGTDSECVIPAGEKWCLDADMDVATLTIRGSLIWDTSIAGITLRIRCNF